MLLLSRRDLTSVRKYTNHVFLSRRDYTSRHVNPLVAGGDGVYTFYKWVANNIQSATGGLEKPLIIFFYSYLPRHRRVGVIRVI